MKKILTLMLMILTFAFLSACFDSGTSTTSENDSSSDDAVSSQEATGTDKESSSEDDTDNESSEVNTDKDSSAKADNESSEGAGTDKDSSSEGAPDKDSSSETNPGTDSSEDKAISSSSEPDPVSSDTSIDTGGAPAGSPVAKYGFLTTKDNTLWSEKASEAVQLIGMSLYWSQWGATTSGSFYKEEIVSWLALDWKIDVIRAAIGTFEEGEGDVTDADGNPTGDKEHNPSGYMQKPDIEMAKAVAVIDAAIANGIYVIVDWHDHHADEPEHAIAEKEFFTEIATKYGEYPNIIYETFNEPKVDGSQGPGYLGFSWDEARIMTHQQEVIDVIRAIDSKNHVIVGSKAWSSNPIDVANAVENGVLTDGNISGAMHLYADKLMDAGKGWDFNHVETHIPRSQEALDKGLPVFASEWGTSDPVVQLEVGVEETEVWVKWMKDNKVSWCNWSVHDKEEANSALVLDASLKGNWGPDELTESGLLIRKIIREAHGEPGEDFPN
ncbi:MAG: cellulase family glycosylhydrolase [Fibrobacterales bacterium]